MPAAFGVRLTSTRALLSVTRGRRFLIAMLSLVAIGAAMPLTARAAAPAPANGTELNTTSSTANLSAQRPATSPAASRFAVGARFTSNVAAGAVPRSCLKRAPATTRGSGTLTSRAAGRSFPPSRGSPACAPTTARGPSGMAPWASRRASAGAIRSQCPGPPGTSSSTCTRCSARPHLPAAHLRGPYVLAGHSFGGMIARLYATTYPEAGRGSRLNRCPERVVHRRVQAAPHAAAIRRCLPPSDAISAGFPATPITSSSLWRPAGQRCGRRRPTRRFAGCRWWFSPTRSLTRIRLDFQQTGRSRH